MNKGEVLSSEYQILLASVKPTSPDDRLAEIRGQTTPDTDWSHVVRLARSHGVVPLVADLLSEANDVTVPDDVRAWLQGRTRTAVMRNLFLVNQMQQMRELLEQEQIPAIFFKGPLLAQDAYGSLALRSSGDVDVLVPPAHLLKVEALLLDQGFVPFTKIQRLSEGRKRAHLFLTRQLPYRSQNRADVDLHSGVVGLGYGFQISFEEMYGRGREIDISGTRIQSFSLEDLLLVLCYQGVNNRWAAVKYLCDVGHLITRQPEIDWALVHQRARAMNGERILYHALDLVEKFLGAAMPDLIRNTARRNRGARRASTVVANHLREGSVPPLTFTERMRYYPAVQSSISGKARYLLYSLARRAISPALD